MIKIALQPTIYSGIVAGMQAGNEPWIAPKGLFYQIDGDIAPFTPQPTVLRIETNRVGEAITVLVEHFEDTGAGVDRRDKRTSYNVVAASEVVTLGVQLSRGKNRITAFIQNRSGEIAYLIVKATTITALWEAFGRVIYNESFSVIDEQKRAVSSALATRLIEPFISFQDLLPDLQSLKILATRLAVKGLLHSVGTDLGVTQLIQSLTLTTPIYRSIDKDTFEVYPSLDPWTRTASQFGGREAHAWLPNLGIISWTAFLHYVSNQPDLFEIVKITEREVVVNYQGVQQKHLFDFDAFGTDFLTAQAASECFKSILINVEILTELDIPICAASYTFDLWITEDNLIGDCRRTLDSGVPFDSSCPFDAEPLDPWTDGWKGLSLTGRFEQDSPYTHPLDTFVIPSTAYSGPLCGYEGYYTQIVENQRYDLDLDLTVWSVTGHIQTALNWVLESPDGTRWTVEVNAGTSTLIATSGTGLPVSGRKVTKPDSSEAAFDITNDGVIVVVSPPPGGELLDDSLYILGTDSTVWHVQVDNGNVINVTRIFPV
jgi:hypothetical protein